MSGIHVTSEIGKLKKVCLHRPGDELLNLPPFELERLLFDDVPFLEVAQQEHDKFAELMRGEGVEVVYLEKMVAEIFDEKPELRAQFLDEYLREAGIANPAFVQAAREKLESIEDNLEFVNKTIAGLAKSEVDLPKGSTLAALAAGDDDSDLVIDPMPNLYFQRDPFACIGNGVSLNRMYSVTRNRETLYGKYLFEYHKDYAGTPLWYDRDATFHIEGGDILNLSRTALAIGVSQRTQAAAIDQIAQNIFWKTEGCEIEKIFAFDIPKAVFLGEITEKADSTNEFITYAVGWIKELIDDSLNAKLVGEKDYLKGERIWIDMSRYKHRDLVESAANLDKLRSIGFTFDEILEAIGREPLNTEFSQERVVTKNYTNEMGGNGSETNTEET